MADLDSVSIDFAKRFNKAVKVFLKLSRNSVKPSKTKSSSSPTSSKSTRSVNQQISSLKRKGFRNRPTSEQWKSTLWISMPG